MKGIVFVDSGKPAPAGMKTEPAVPPEPPTRDCSVACGGRCCKAFTLPITPADLDDPEQMARFKDGPQIAAMVIVLPREEGGVQQYTCKHLQADGLCGNYAARPSMCREFPYGRPCPHPGCPSAAEAPP